MTSEKEFTICCKTILQIVSDGLQSCSAGHKNCKLQVCKLFQTACKMGMQQQRSGDGTIQYSRLLQGLMIRKDARHKIACISRQYHNREFREIIRIYDFIRIIHNLQEEYYT